MNPFRIVGVIGKHRDVHWSMLSAVTEALTELGCQVLLEASPGMAECDGLARLRGRHRRQLLLKSASRPSLRRLLDQLPGLQKELPAAVSLAVDVDPVDML